MTKAQVERYRRLLTDLMARMQGDATAVTDQVREPSGGQGSGALSNAPMHLGDVGTEEYLRDLNATLLEHEEFLAGEVVAALDRIAKGKFGICERCGKAIIKERLDAIPYARYCTPCAEIMGRNGGSANLNAGRPRGPQDTLAPEGNMEEDIRESRAEIPFTDVEPANRAERGVRDQYAAGEPGGGSALGGLAGSNAGYGDPEVGELRDAMARGDLDDETIEPEEKLTPQGGTTGGAVGGTPARKRARGVENPRPSRPE